VSGKRTRTGNWSMGGEKGKASQKRKEMKYQSKIEELKDFLFAAITRLK